MNKKMDKSLNDLSIILNCGGKSGDFTRPPLGIFQFPARTTTPRSQLPRYDRNTRKR